MKAFTSHLRIRALPYVEARTKAQFQGTANPVSAGALFEETTTAFSVYNEGDWGCHSPVPRQYGASKNSVIQFHWTGALALTLMTLDYYAANGDDQVMRRYLPIGAAVVEAFRQRFPNRDKAGKIDMFPSQALEPTCVRTRVPVPSAAPTRRPTSQG